MNLESMTIDDVCDFLEDRGYPESLVDIFRGTFTPSFFAELIFFCLFCLFIFFPSLEQEMDGAAIKFGLGTSPGPQWLQEIVPVLGQRLKVHNELRTLCMKDQEFKVQLGLCV